MDVRGMQREKALKEYFHEAFGVELSKDDVSTNTDSGVVIGSYS